jgi:hypothetical protein
MGDTSKESLANNQPGKLTPSADPVSAKRKRLSQRDKMKQQLDSVLACLEEGQKAETCCQTLLPRKAQFEYLLTEIVRTATGQRQTAAIAAMGFVGSDGTVPLLLEIAEKPDLRTTAVQSVKRASSEQMLAALVLQGGDVATRKELLIELAHRKTPQAAFIWLHLVRTPDCRDLCCRSLMSYLRSLLTCCLLSLMHQSLMTALPQFSHWGEGSMSLLSKEQNCFVRTFHIVGSLWPF